MECAGQQREPVEQPRCEQTSTFTDFMYAKPAEGFSGGLKLCRAIGTHHTV